MDFPIQVSHDADVCISELTQFAFCHRLLQTSLEGNVIRSQDLLHVTKTISQYLPGHLLAWNFVKENWSQLVQK